MIDQLIGKTLSSIDNLGDEMIFHCTDGTKYRMYHWQDCCESVSIEEIIGDLDDLVDTPILVAEERSEDDPEASELGMWTFYEFRTIKGSVTIRWYGSSNGYYGVGVFFEEFKQ